MGSWANSLHIRHQDAEAVNNAIRLLMIGQGFREQAVEQPKLASVSNILDADDLEISNGVAVLPSDGHPFDSDEHWDDEEDEGEWEEDYFAAEVLPLGPIERNICVFRSRHGWVGVLDSGDVCELGQLLSGQLHTEAIAFMVNDSDSWWFQIHRTGVPFDEFDSMGETGDGEISAEMMAAIESGDEDALMREMLKNAPQGPIHMPDGSALVPPELALLTHRIQAGQASFWDRCRYWWLSIKFLFQLFTGRWQPHPIEMGFDIPRVTPLAAETLQQHIDRLKAIFPHADEQALRDLLPLNRFPSEDLLRKFLQIVDLPSLYAYLNYDYLEEHTREELGGEGIVWHSELRFRKD
jgi:hypothetical protein